MTVLTPSQSWEPSMAIIGAGCSGIILGLKLKAIGFHNFTIFERDSDVGGTWLTNTYPGCRCDVPAHWYSLSTHLNPNWTETHPPQTEILDYWQKLAKDNGLYEHCQFRTSFVNARWDESTSSYRIRLKEGTRFGPDTPDAPSLNKGQKGSPTEEIVEKSFNILVSCIGGFSFPLVPKMNGLPNPYKDDKPILEKPDELLERYGHGAAVTGEVAQEHGVDEFKGLVLHPSRWPRQGVDLHDKKVIVFGNGCSGVQIVPEIAKDPSTKVYAVVRSAQWLLPSDIRPISDFTRFLFRKSSLLLRVYRFLVYIQLEWAWLLFPYSNHWLRNIAEKRVAAHIRKNAPADCAENMVPTFPMGAKRIVRDVDYLDALNTPNVETITSPVERFTEHEFVTADGKSHDVDVVVLATGYDVTASTLDVTGRDGMRASTAILGDDSPRGYHGLALPKFPNHWLCLSLNTAPGHGSVLMNIEVQAAYITQCVNAMRKFNVKVLEVKEEPTREYNAWLDRRLENTVWAKGSSFYRLGNNRNGRIFTNWPGPIALYWWQNSSPKWQDWIGADKIAAKAQSKRRRMFIDVALVLTGLVYFWLKFAPK